MSMQSTPTAGGSTSTTAAPGGNEHSVILDRVTTVLGDWIPKVNTRLDNFQDWMGVAQERIDQARDIFAALHNWIPSIDGGLATLNSRASGLDHRITRIDHHLTGTNNRLNMIEAKIDVLISILQLGSPVAHNQSRPPPTPLLASSRIVVVAPMTFMTLNI
ncbi:hypothetical protein BD779DRAFT_1672622 [Infundibulicybe gibba]|nr:hypothetical protein BD779DRAFT_1672622 [Infundibulicybe gibba]